MSEEQLKEKEKPPFATQLASMISDPDFLQIYTLNEQPNLFRAVARTYTETWHSAFLGWLLDPRGSHQLEDFPLIRFLVAVATEALPPTDSNGSSSTFGYILSPPQLAALAITRDLTNAKVQPNEKERDEKVIGARYRSSDSEDLDQKKVNGSRIDVWIEDIEDDANVDSAESEEDRFVCIVEEKIKATVGLGQAKKYADYIEDESKHNPKLRGVCVLLSPKCDDELASSYDLAEDSRWYCLSFQALHDYVLIPCLEHPDMDTEMAVCLRHYIRNLRMVINGRSLAMSKEERELAEKVVGKYKDTLKLLAKVLKESDGDFELENTLAKQDGQSPLCISIPGEKPVEGATIPELFYNILQRLQDTNRLNELEIPLARGKSCLILNTEPFHSKEKQKPFRGKPVCFESNGKKIYMNTWYGREDGLNIGVRVLQKAGITNAKAMTLDEEE